MKCSIWINTNQSFQIYKNYNTSIDSPALFYGIPQLIQFLFGWMCWTKSILLLITMDLLDLLHVFIPSSSFLFYFRCKVGCLCQKMNYCNSILRTGFTKVKQITCVFILCSKFLYDKKFRLACKPSLSWQTYSVSYASAIGFSYWLKCMLFVFCFFLPLMTMVNPCFIYNPPHI